MSIEYKRPETARITVRIPTEDIKSMDEFIEAGEFCNRSEFIRHAYNEFRYSHFNELIEKFQRKIYDSASPSFLNIVERDELYREKYGGREIFPTPSWLEIKNSKYVFGSNGRLIASEYPYDFAF